MSDTALLPPDEVRRRIVAIEAEMNTQYLERRPAIEAMRLAVLAKEHCTILGTPGTAKSAMTRGFFARFTGASYFEALLSKSRPAEAVLGPYDIPELRDNGHLFRKITGFLPTCNLAMLDEIGKMSPTLGHDLLSVILERRLHQVNGGRSWVDVPLYTVIGGSNEIPTDEDTDAAALWDRFVLRWPVESIKEAGNFIAMLQGVGELTNPTTIDWPSMAEVIDNVIPAITIGQEVFEVIIGLRETLLGEGLVASDRRWKQTMKLLRAQAFFSGRGHVEVDDISVLRYALWEQPNQIQTVERLTLSVANPLSEAAMVIQTKADEIGTEFRNAHGQSQDTQYRLAARLSGQLNSLRREVGDLRQKALSKGASTGKIDEVTDAVKALQSRILTEVTNVPQDA